MLRPDRHALARPGDAAAYEQGPTVHTDRARRAARLILDEASPRRYMLVHHTADRVARAIKTCSEHVGGDGFCDCVRQLTAMVVAGRPFLEEHRTLEVFYRIEDTDLLDWAQKVGAEIFLRGTALSNWYAVRFPPPGGGMGRLEVVTQDDANPGDLRDALRRARHGDGEPIELD